MANRVRSAATWLLEQTKLYLWPGAPRMRPRRCRQVGLLKLLIELLLLKGPCTLETLVGCAHTYNRGQVVAGLGYARRRGLVVRLSDGCWSRTGAAVLRRLDEASPKPGEWFPAKFGVPRAEFLTVLGPVQSEGAAERIVAASGCHEGDAS